jgi:hypothetical protein
MLGIIESFRLLRSLAPSQGGDGADELLEPGAGKPHLKIVKRNRPIATS